MSNTDKVLIKIAKKLVFQIYAERYENLPKVKQEIWKQWIKDQILSIKEIHIEATDQELPDVIIHSVQLPSHVKLGHFRKELIEDNFIKCEHKGDKDGH